MKSHVIAKRWLAISTMAWLCYSPFAAAQNESGKRPINRQKFEQLGYWYNSTTAMYQTRYPIIRSLPPLNSGMPWDILGAYIYMDSIARFDVQSRTFKSIERWTDLSQNDTLKGLVKYLYKLTDHDPIIFRQYRDEVDLHRWDRYKTSLNSIAEQVKKTFLKVAPNKDERLALYSMIYPDYILRVRVTAIDSAELASTIVSHKFRVKCEILDTLKGQKISTCPDQLLMQQPPPKAVVYTNPPCFKFQYTHRNYWPSGTFDQIDYPYQIKDPAFSVGDDNGFAMQVGQEAIVFLTHHASVVDSSFDYYDIDLEPEASYNALPIINGRVRDVNRIWSNDTTMSYGDWKNHFFQLREKILTMTY